MPYPLELRQRVLNKRAQGLTQPQIAKELDVSLGWVNKVLQCQLIHGTLTPPRRKPGRERKLQEQHHALLRDWLAQQPELTLVQLAEKMTAHKGATVNPTNIADALRLMDYTYKKNGRARRTTAR